MAGESFFSLRTIIIAGLAVGSLFGNAQQISPPRHVSLIEAIQQA